jgi:nucleoside-diphosphate-sugar epimerase
LLILNPLFNKDVQVKVLLTGATGFIGSQLTRRLIAEKHQVAILVRPDSTLEILQAVLPQMQVHVYDGSYACLVRALGFSQPELVIHVASLFLAQHNAEDVSRLIESNLKFPTQLLEAMSQLGIYQLINTGTSWQHYQNQAYSPVNLYAATKQAFESLLTYYAEAQGFKAITLKLFDTYGPGDTRLKLLPLLKRATNTGEILEMSPGEQVIDLVHVEDVMECFIAAGYRLLRGEVSLPEVYAVCSGEPLSLKELVETIAQISGKQLNVKWGVKQYRRREVMQPWTSGGTLPGWSPRISLAAGLREYIES